MTPSDAVFVAKMIRTMHDIGTPGFTTVFAYLQVSRISPSLQYTVSLTGVVLWRLATCVHLCLYRE